MIQHWCLRTNHMLSLQLDTTTARVPYGGDSECPRQHWNLWVCVHVGQRERKYTCVFSRLDFQARTPQSEWLYSSVASALEWEMSCSSPLLWLRSLPRFHHRTWKLEDQQMINVLSARWEWRQDRGGGDIILESKSGQLTSGVRQSEQVSQVRWFWWRKAADRDSPRSLRQYWSPSSRCWSCAGQCHDTNACDYNKRQIFFSLGSNWRWWSIFDELHS